MNMYYVQVRNSLNGLMITYKVIASHYMLAAEWVISNTKYKHTDILGVIYEGE